MCKLQFLFAFVALAIHQVNSWDIAITTGDKLEFYSNGNKTSRMTERARDLTALAYDAVYNMLLFVDKQDDNASIFSYHPATNSAQPLVRKKSYEDIQGIAFDPITGKLFWTDGKIKGIYWKSLMPGSKNDMYGNVLVKLNDEIPRAIAVDSCRGYVYWSNTNITKPSIERARFDGSEREIIISTDIYMPVSLVIDQRTRKLYWADDKEGIHYSIESSDLDGKNRVTLLADVNHQPNALAVTKDDLYWIDWAYMVVWKLPKNAKRNASPTELFKFVGMPFGIVANYKIADQTAGIPECETLAKLSANKSAIDNSLTIPADAGVHCLHGVKTEVKVNEQATCKCSLGYTGERCEIPVCQNYCLQGSCNVTAEGLPKCSCNTGFTGVRCEVDICLGHCLNGRCSVRQGKPVCECPSEYEGQRCETVKVKATAATIQADTCNCTQVQNIKPDIGMLSPTDGEFVESCSEWDSVRDPIIMVLGTLCGMLCVASAFLITKILQLKKRPRIKKRIIVNKNVTPLTARPDQCEITIENCCNMNICETPCFEPRSTIRPNLLDAKPGKEEKKNLIANMELPDDY